MDVVKILPALNQCLGCRTHPHLALTQAPGSFFDQGGWPARPSPPALAQHLPASLFLGVPNEDGVILFRVNVFCSESY